MKIDASEYPVVRIDSKPAHRVAIDCVLAEFSRLLAREEAFVFIGEGLPLDGGGDPEDARVVSRWMRINRAALSRLVKGQVQIITDPDARQAAETFSLAFAYFWGYPMFVVGSEQEARIKVISLLSL
ncbi:hypothetical protein F9C28_07270 [Shimwellia pseudoproteus]|uniref:hypothetical protein n=1 Tax=Shimwellia pseudoproteus TaxID=570012 RepID=UPI0018EAE9C7|nr:hypothetical protein [Shimwellia pseudoproteus]MBJ3814725.1 hypothetical protein [Shimwellia pseudoproteus]